MDGQRFDELTKALAAGGVSRRGVLRGLFGSAVGGVLAAVGFGDAAAQAIQCDRGEVRCRGASGDYCAEPRTDPANCGRCGRLCGGMQVCYAGRCLDSCPSGFEACGSVCCGRGEVCKFGNCEPESIGLSAPPVAVWQALTSPSALAAWGMENTVVPQVGHRFELRMTPRAGYDGVMEGEVLELDAPRRVVFAWRGGPLVEPATVTITLEPIADGRRTRLRLTQGSGTDAPCNAAALVLGQNWQHKLFAEALPRYLEGHRRSGL